MRMHDNNGWWGYFWASATATLTSLSFQDVVFAIGAVLSGVIGIATFLSNRKKNNATAAAIAKTEAIRQEQELERTRMLGEYLGRGYKAQDKEVPNNIVEAMKMAENSGKQDESTVTESRV